MEQLQERFHSRGLGSRGAVQILTKVLQFGVKLKALAKLGSHGRADRQAARTQQHQAWMRDMHNLRGTQTHFKDEHFMMSEHVDFASSSLGNFDSRNIRLIFGCMQHFVIPAKLNQLSSYMEIGILPFLIALDSMYEHLSYADSM